jgi:hypothetical protein
MHKLQDLCKSIGINQALLRKNNAKMIPPDKWNQDPFLKYIIYE